MTLARTNARLIERIRYKFSIYAFHFGLVILAVFYSYIYVWVIAIAPISYSLTLLLPPVAILFWVYPDTEFKLDVFLVPLIYLFITSEIAIPNFYALPIGGIGWVNFRKFINLTLLGTTLLAYSTSPNIRSTALLTLRDNKVVVGGSIAFLGFILCSLPLSSNINASFAYLPQALTTWYTALAAILAIPQLGSRLLSIFRWLVANLIFLAVVCGIEGHLKRRVMFDIMPASLIHSLLANPAFSMLYLSDETRSGSFRSAASFSSPLSTGECAAMIMPISFLLAFECPRFRDRVLGYAGIFAVATVLFSANARGALLASLVVIVLYSVLVIYRRQRKENVSLLPALLSLIALTLLPAFATTKRFRFTVFGGGATGASNDGRMEQLHLATPKIFQSPLWGHGIGTAADIVNFNPGDYVTLDSGMLAILVDLGIPAFLVFLIILVYPIFRSMASWMNDQVSFKPVIGLYLSLSLIAFAVNNFVLAQIENFGLLFLLLGLFSVWNSDCRTVEISTLLEHEQVPVKLRFS